MTTENWFHGCFTEQEVKARYRDLCKIHHPDLGGNTEMMQAVNAAYEVRLRQRFESQGMSADDVEEAVDMEAAVAAKVAEIIALEGIIVELVGRWVWVTGNTFPVKDAIKKAGFWFASKKRAWYWHTPESSCRRSGKTLEEIKQKYGSKTLRGAGTFLGN